MMTIEEQDFQPFAISKCQIGCHTLDMTCRKEIEVVPFYLWHLSQLPLDQRLNAFKLYFQRERTKKKQSNQPMVRRYDSLYNRK